MTISDTRRRFPRTTKPFIRNADIQANAVTSLEGQGRNAPGTLAIKPLVVGQDTLLMEVHRAKGLVDAEHAHPDHESICYLVSGKMHVVIDGESFIAGPGDSWIHPAGVPHYHETLEDSVQIEIKSPPMRPWG
jgi:quercetin dioxygenase-like cupin family protein